MDRDMEFRQIKALPYPLSSHQRPLESTGVFRLIG